MDLTVDTDRSGSITADELQRALVNGNWSSKLCRYLSFFSLNSCQGEIADFDLDTVKML